MEDKALVFPIIMIKKMPKKTVLGRYFERAKPRRIELSPVLAGCDKELRKFIVLHEIGHWFRYEHVPQKMVRQFKTKEDREENFAHTFANYFMAPSKVKEDEPMEYELLQSFLDDEKKQKILAFADECLGILDKEVGQVMKNAA